MKVHKELKSLSAEELNSRAEEIKKEIVKKVGQRPALPTDLPKGDWTEQALKVLKERYLVFSSIQR